MQHEDSRSEKTITLDADGVSLDGTLNVPSGATGVVLFAHGSGSSRFSPRNRYVAQVLNDAGFGTLLLDLLSPAEESRDSITAEHRFDIPLLASRLVAAIDWLERNPSTAKLPVGLFGASTGGGAALVAASERPRRISAVVSRGGRPDLAAETLPTVAAPTLLIVGGEDDVVIALNERARSAMRAATRLEIVPGATHLFEEPGALEQVAALARDFFRDNIGDVRAPASRSAGSGR